MFVKNKDEKNDKQRQPRQEVTRSLLEDSFWDNKETYHSREILAQSLSNATEKRESNQSLANKTPDPIPTYTLIKGFVIGALSLGGVASSLAAMILEANPLVYVAGSVCTIAATTVVVKEYKLVTQPTVRSEVNDLRIIVNKLKEEIDDLGETIDQFEQENERLKPTADLLSQIASEQGESVDRIVELVKRNGEQLKWMKKLLLDISIEEIIKIFLISDWNCNFRIDNENEVRHVALRVEIKLTSMGFKFDREKFEKYLRKNSDVSTVIKYLRKNLEADSEEKVIDCNATIVSTVSSRTLQSIASLQNETA